MDIAIGVKEARSLRGHSQRELSRMIGANASYINRLESGTLVPSLPMLRRIVKELEVPLVQIIEWSMTEDETKYLQKFRDGKRARIAQGSADSIADR